MNRNFNKEHLRSDFSFNSTTTSFKDLGTTDGEGTLVRGFGPRARSNTPGIGGYGSGNELGGLGMGGNFDPEMNNEANAIEGAYWNEAENAVYGMGGGYESGSKGL